MKVNFKKSATYKTPVSFTISGEGGEKEDQGFVAEFKRMTTSQVKAIQHIAANSPGMTMSELVSKIVVGWELYDDDQKAVPFSSAALDAAFEAVPGLAAHILLTFYETVGAAKVKP
jgi:hypothetical protein